VSFAAGGLFGDAFIHLLPEAFKAEGSSLRVSLFIVMGIFVFFVLEKFLRWRHCHISDCEKHLHPVVTMNLIGDAVHNLIDGMLIGASFSVSVPIGVASTLAIIFHEIPQEMGEFGVLIHGGLSVRKALVFNLLSAMTAFIGAGFSLLIGGRVIGYSAALLPITAGGFLYIAGSDLIPELHHELELGKSIWQLIFMILGVAVMALLILLE
jgi:zinc and cadmium transporter